MKRVLLDVDGVLANFIQATLNSLVQLGGPEVHHEDIKTWNMFSSLPSGWEDGLLAEWHRSGWCRDIPLYAGAQEGVMKVREHAKVLFVTTAMEEAPHWMWEREQWLRDHFNAGPRDVVFTAAKYAIGGDLFADDKTANVIEWATEYPTKIAVLWDSPTNRKDILPPNVHRVTSWDGLLDLLNA